MYNVDVVGAALCRRFTAQVKSSSTATRRTVMDCQPLSTYQSLFLSSKVGNLLLLIFTTFFKTRKLCCRKDDHGMRFCSAILIQYRYHPATKVGLLSSDVNKGAWQIPCQNYRLRPGAPLVSPKFLHVPLGVGG